MGTDSATKWIVGVDAGGSKTTAHVATFDPSNARWSSAIQLCGEGDAGPSNPRSVGFASAFEQLELAIQRAFADAKRPALTADAICICIAGLVRADEQEPVWRWAKSNSLAHRIHVSEDIAPIRWAAMLEHEAAARTPDPTSMRDNAALWRRTVTLISGTGTIASANDDADGRFTQQDLRVGGWGYLLGDEGSGFAMGLQGLQEVCRAHDAGESLTPFHRGLLERFGCSSPLDLIPRVYAHPVPRAEIAALNRVVMEHLEDPAAHSIIERAARELAFLVATAARRRGFSHGGYGLALSGGNVGHRSPLVPRLLEELERNRIAPGQTHHVTRPALGALAMAAHFALEGSHPEPSR